MANFRPLKQYLIYLLDEMAKKYDLREPFLDAACGTGDIALHFARKGWKGKAVDLSRKAVEKARSKLFNYRDKVEVEHGNILNIKGEYNTVFLCDVLEHLDNDQNVLAHIKLNMNKSTRLIVSVPVFQSEWRWDDDFYGHSRRYEIENLQNIFAKNGIEILVIWDFTFPVFWFLRRLYTVLIPAKLVLPKSSKKYLTRVSSLNSAWDLGILTTLIEKIIWWRPVFYLQSKLKEKIRGCECVLLCRLKN